MPAHRSATELLEELRNEGMRLSVEDHLRVGRLLSYRDSWPPEVLRDALRCVLARSADEQDLFDQVFDRLTGRDEAVEETPQDEKRPSPEGSAPAPDRPPRPRRRWRTPDVLAWVTFASAVLLVVSVIWTSLYPDAPPPEGQPDDSATEAGPRLGGAHFDMGMADSQKLGLQGTSQIGGFLDEGPPQHLLSQRPGPGVNRAWVRKELTPSQWVGYGLMGLSGAVLLLWLLGLLHRRWARKRFVPGPWEHRLAVPRAHRTRAYSPWAVASAMERLGWPPGEAPGRALDVVGTVLRSAEAGGCPRLVYTPQPRQPEYAILFDSGPGTETWRPLLVELFERLIERGLAATCYELSGDPSWCHPMGEPRRRLRLEQLAETADAVIVIGEGPDELGSPSGDGLPWLDVLAAWPYRVWLNPLPPSRWSAGARAIAARVPMAQATTEALAGLWRGTTEAGEPAERWFVPIIEALPGSWRASRELEAYLSPEGYRALQVAAVADRPDPLVASWLIEQVGLSLTEADRLRLLTLPWFRGRRWPEGLSRRLTETLARDHPDLARRARRAFMALLDGSEPPKGSLAHLRWELSRAVQPKASAEEAAKDNRTLAGLARSPLAAEASEARARAGMPPIRTWRVAVVTLSFVVATLALSLWIGRSNAMVYVADSWLCEQRGDPAACRREAYRYVRGEGVAEDETRGVELFRRACVGGDPEGCFNLGAAYFQGRGGLERNESRAVELFRQACDGGAAVGCYGLGVMYAQGRGGLPRDDSRAVELYRQACDGGAPMGCHGLGAMYAQGRGGLPRDESRAVELFRQACDGGYPMGCSGLGAAYFHGFGGLERNESRAVELFRQVCDGGEPMGCHGLGVAYFQGLGGLERNESRAVELFRQACDGGEPMGCHGLGGSYFQGLGGLERNESRAVELFRQACDGGAPMGCHGLGAAYFQGRGGLERNESRAVELFRQACDGGEPRGCHGLGAMYAQGLGGLPRDESRAVELWRRACDGRVSMGCYNLGVAYRDGLDGLARDDSRAVELFRQACDGRVAMGCYNLGAMYAQGRGGLPRDESHAVELFRQACDGGLGEACNDLGRNHQSGLAGLAPDVEAASRYYRMACRAGFSTGCYNLAELMIAHPREGEPDLRGAARFYRRACHGGEMLGCLELARLLEQGEGVPQDVAQARRLFEHACQGGHGLGDACAEAERLRGQ